MKLIDDPGRKPDPHGPPSRSAGPAARAGVTALADGARSLSLLALGLLALGMLQQLGALVARAVGLPVPGALVGMILLLGLLLSTRAGRFQRVVQRASAPLLGHMMLFFIPAVAGIVDQGPALSSGWLPFLAACIVGAALTLAATGLTLKVLLARQLACDRRPAEPG